MDDLITTLPTLEELEARGPADPGRFLTPEERARAGEERKKKKPHLVTKRKSEALCKRQLEKWGADIDKVRDDLVRLANGQEIRVSKDVDFTGTIPLLWKGDVIGLTLKVESKGITLKSGRSSFAGSFPLSSLSAKERHYLEKNRKRGGLSVVHFAWWHDGECIEAHVIRWMDWPTIEAALLAKTQDDKRFKGKSLRFHADHDLLKPYRVYKLSGQWTFCQGHWLPPLLANGRQPTLL